MKRAISVFLALALLAHTGDSRKTKGGAFLSKQQQNSAGYTSSSSSMPSSLSCTRLSWPTDEDTNDEAVTISPYECLCVCDVLLLPVCVESPKARVPVSLFVYLPVPVCMCLRRTGICYMEMTSSLCWTRWLCCPPVSVGGADLARFNVILLRVASTTWRLERWPQSDRRAGRLAQAAENPWVSRYPVMMGLWTGSRLRQSDRMPCPTVQTVWPYRHTPTRATKTQYVGYSVCYWWWRLTLVK